MAAKAKAKAKTRVKASPKKEVKNSTVAKTKSGAKTSAKPKAKAPSKPKAQAKTKAKVAASKAPKAKAKAKVAPKAKAKVEKPSTAKSKQSKVAKVPIDKSKVAKAKVAKTKKNQTPVKSSASKSGKSTPAPVTAAVKAKPKKEKAAISQAMVDFESLPRSNPNSPFKNFTPYAPAKGEDYMNADQQKHFRHILTKWRQELMEEVDRTVHHMRDEAANFPDPADRATQEEEFSIELRTRDRERKLIKKIDQTIELVDAEDYGYCDTCGIEIGLRRLEARPTATQCVDCKSLDEIKERQLHG